MRLILAAFVAVFLCLAATAQAKTKSKIPLYSGPPERHGPIDRPPPVIGIPPCVVDSKIPCERAVPVVPPVTHLPLRHRGRIK